MCLYVSCCCCCSVVVVVVGVGGGSGGGGVVVGVGGVVVGVVGAYNSTNNGFSIILFLFLVPLINAYFDFVSMRFSRFFALKAFRQNSFKQILTEIVFDLCIALFLLLLLLVSLSCIFSLFNHGYFIATGTKQSFAYLFESTMQDPFGKGAFLTLMIFTTLIPTAIHIGIGLLALSMSFVKANIKQIKNETLEQIPRFVLVFIVGGFFPLIALILYWLYSYFQMSSIYDMIRFLCSQALFFSQSVLYSSISLIGVIIILILIQRIKSFDERNLPAST